MFYPLWGESVEKRIQDQVLRNPQRLKVRTQSHQPSEALVRGWHKAECEVHKGVTTGADNMEVTGRSHDRSPAMTI